MSDKNDSEWTVQKSRRKGRRNNEKYNRSTTPDLKHPQTNTTSNKPTKVLTKIQKPKPKQKSNKIDYTVTHSLYTTFSYWYFRKERGVVEKYEDKIMKIGDFGTVEKFWAFYGHLIRPSDINGTNDYHLFKKGIKPMWEDEANVNGGKWMVRCKKDYSPRLWEDLTLAVVGNQFDHGEEICGIVISVREHHDIISVWNKTSENKTARHSIRDALKKFLKLPPGTVLEYKSHTTSLKDNSSFRNTETFRC